MISRLYPSILLTLLVAIPLFFWTLTPNMYATPKEFVLTLGILSLIVVTIIHLWRGLPLALPSPSISFPLLFILLSTVATLLVNPEGRPEALSSKGMSFLILPILSLGTAMVASQSLRHSALLALTAVSTTLSLHALLSLTWLSKSLYLPLYMQSLSFTPTGNYLTTLALIVIGTTSGVALLKTAKDSLKPVLITTIVMGIIATVAIVSLMLPGSALSPVLINHSASWSIALDALKSLRTLFFGIGLSNYSLLYTSVRPLSLNLTPLWNTLPGTATSEFLTLLPTAGLALTLSLLYLMILAIRRSLASPLLLPLLSTILAFWFIPAGLSLYALLFILYALAPQPAHSQYTPSPVVKHTLLATLLMIFVFVIYLTSKTYASEYLIRQAQRALNANDSQRVYELHLRALRYSPAITNYHLSFAEINFRLASAISQKTELKDSDRDTITRLIQQSIESGKTAISLRPNDYRTWLTVAKIYQNLINVADGAERFALDTYSKTVALDRANPALRLEFATLLSQLADLQTDPQTADTLNSRALAEMQTAIQLKNNYANAYYNLAKLYAKLDDLESAITAMTRGIEYLDPQSTDYALGLAELESLKAKHSQPKPTPTPSPSPTPSEILDLTELSQPSPLPSPIDGGPIEIINE